MTCILCGSEKLVSQVIEKKTYFSCATCELIFLNPEERLSQDDEKARYELHENDVLDSGYQAFVAPLFTQITQKVSKTAVGLDYGSGKDSAISYLLNQAGYKIRKFDPYFFVDCEALQRTYDYVVVCEVAEHFCYPDKQFEKLKKLLNPGGFLFIMTSLKTPQIDFTQWSYRRDVTHVCFYSEKTLVYLTKQFGFEVSHIELPNLVTFISK
jgi:SAM-dependent methyltransferase